jgi:hypothetical protein
MSSDRREFLQQAPVVAAGLGASAFQVAALQRSSTIATVRASALMAAFGLRYPIFCAGFGLSATPELAIAVSNGGGLGALGTGSAAFGRHCTRACLANQVRNQPAVCGELFAGLRSRHDSGCARRRSADYSVRVGHSRHGEHLGPFGQLARRWLFRSHASSARGALSTSGRTT